MNLNSMDLNQVQALLFKLVQALPSLAGPEEKAPFPLSERPFFIPPQAQNPHQTQAQSLSTKHPVRLLSTLHHVQKEVEGWVQEPRNGTSKPSTTLPSQLQKGTSPSSLSTFRQVQTLIHQVQEAIVHLSSSTPLEEKKTFIQQTLTEIKPKLDAIIETMVHSQNQVPPKEETRSQKKLKPSASKREEIETQKVDPQELPRRKVEELPSEKKKTFVLLSQEEGTFLPKAQEGRGALFRPPAILPGAPFLSSTKPLAPSRKKKKKPLFGSREEEEEKS